MTDPPRLEALFETLAAQERHAARSDVVRLAVRLRARDACEYCLRPTLGPFHVEHVIPPERWDDYAAGRIEGLSPLAGRRGPDHVDNYAWCCWHCNYAKGARVELLLGTTLHRLFDPRRDRWRDHFVLADSYLIVVGVSGIGRATEMALRLNDGRPGGPAAVRQRLAALDQYPPGWARRWASPGVEPETSDE